VIPIRKKRWADILEGTGAPAQLRDGATVIKWKPDFTYDTLKKGTSRLVCYDRSGLPEQQAFSIECTSVGNLDRVAQNLKAEAKGDKKASEAALMAEEKDGTRVKPEFGSVWYHSMAGPDPEHPRSHMTIAVPFATTKTLGLPESGFVFCCFNNAYKLNPELFRSRMRILGAVEGSVLWLSERNETARANLRKEATAAGVNPDRLVFAGYVDSSEDHLARHRAADLFLDTLPYNAHTTASDALWAGLPVLTQMGETFAGRVAAGLLTAIGLPELIVQTQQQFESRAIELATGPELMAAIKGKLADNRLTKPLFNTGLYTRHIESAYATMYQRYQDGIAPDHIYVAE